MNASLDQIRAALEARRLELEEIIRPYAEEVYGIRRALLALDHKPQTNPSSSNGRTGKYVGTAQAIRAALAAGPLHRNDLKKAVEEATGKGLHPALYTLKSRGHVIRNGDMWELAA